MKRCKFLTLMFALLLLLQSSVLAANTDTTVTVTLPTFAVTLNDTKIDSAHSEYPLIVYRDITYFPHDLPRLTLPAPQEQLVSD